MTLSLPWTALILSVWLSVMAWQDMRKKEVSNWLTLPPLFLAAIWWGMQGVWTVPVLLLVLVGLTEWMDRAKWLPFMALPVLLPVLAVMSYYSKCTAEILVLMTWSLSWFAWIIHLVGGADSKVVMAIVGFIPDVRVIGLIVGWQVVWSIIHLVRRYGRGALQVVGANAMKMPTQEDLETSGVAIMPAYALSGWTYLAVALVGIVAG